MALFLGVEPAGISAAQYVLSTTQQSDHRPIFHAQALAEVPLAHREHSGSFLADRVPFFYRLFSIAYPGYRRKEGDTSSRIFSHLIFDQAGSLAISVRRRRSENTVFAFFERLRKELDGQVVATWVDLEDEESDLWLGRPDASGYVRVKTNTGLYTLNLKTARLQTLKKERWAIPVHASMRANRIRLTVGGETVWINPRAPLAIAHSTPLLLKTNKMTGDNNIEFYLNPAKRFSRTEHGYVKSLKGRMTGDRHGRFIFEMRYSQPLGLHPLAPEDVELDELGISASVFRAMRSFAGERISFRLQVPRKFRKGTEPILQALADAGYGHVSVFLDASSFDPKLTFSIDADQSSSDRGSPASILRRSIQAAA